MNLVLRGLGKKKGGGVRGHMHMHICSWLVGWLNQIGFEQHQKGWTGGWQGMGSGSEGDAAGMQALTSFSDRWNGFRYAAPLPD